MGAFLFFHNPSFGNSKPPLGKTFFHTLLQKLILRLKSILIMKKTIFKRKTQFLFLFLLLVGFKPLYSQCVDTDFNTNDFGNKRGDGPNGQIFATAIQSDGKILIGGSYTAVDNLTRNNIARLNTDGSIDNGYAFNAGANAAINCIAIQSDGNAIIGGNFTTYNGASSIRNKIARLTNNGNYDATFSIGTGFTGSASFCEVISIALQPDGKILAVGSFTAFNGTPVNNIVRLNSNGSIDATFTVGIGANNVVRTVALQSDGKIIIGGNFTSYNGTGVNRIARINTNGTIDATFTVGTGANANINVAAIQSDDKILIGGTFTSYNGTLAGRIARLNSNGTLDATFTSTVGFDNAVSGVNDIKIQSDGKVIATGNFTSYNGLSALRLARINTNGSFDASFAIGNQTLDNQGRSITIQPDGKIIISGLFSVCNSVRKQYITRLLSSGADDVSFSFGAGGITNGWAPEVFETVLQSDGKVIVGGNFGLYNGLSANNIARTLPNGDIDPTFNTGLGFSGNGSNLGIVHCASLQNDGKILVGGSFTNYHATPINGIARLNTDGTIDATFTVTSGINSGSKVNDIDIQSDGKIIAVGTFTSYNGSASNRIVRINTDGSIDATFNIGTGANININACVVQSDGKIIIAGDFTNFNGSNYNRICRLNTNGTIDATFNPGTGSPSQIITLCLQSDGKILVGGQFQTFNSNSARYICRLNTNGSLDLTFAIGSGIGANATVNKIAVQSDGKIVIGGGFGFYNNTQHFRLIRVNSNNSPDPTFVIGSSGANDVINTLALQNDNRIIIGGKFTQFGSSGRNRIARIHGMVASNSITVTSNTITALENNATYQWFDCDLGQPISGETNQSYVATQSGLYSVIITPSVGCKSTSSCTNVTVSVTQISENELMNLYIAPNPANDHITIKLDGLTGNNSSIEILNTVGQILLKEDIANELSKNISVSDLSSGIYFVLLKQNGKSIATKKLLINK